MFRSLLAMLADETIAVVAEATPAFCADANQVWATGITDGAIGVLRHLRLAAVVLQHLMHALRFDSLLGSQQESYHLAGMNRHRHVAVVEH